MDIVCKVATQNLYHKWMWGRVGGTPGDQSCAWVGWVALRVFRAVHGCCELSWAMFSMTQRLGGH